MYGDNESLDKVFKRALQQNDQFEIYTRLINIYVASNKPDVSLFIYMYIVCMYLFIYLFYFLPLSLSALSLLISYTKSCVRSSAVISKFGLNMVAF